MYYNLSLVRLVIMSSKGSAMKFSAPKPITWWIAAVTGIIGTLIQFRLIPIAILEPYGAWLVIFGAVLLIIGTAVDFL